jgi:hypothetical protein
MNNIKQPTRDGHWVNQMRAALQDSLATVKTRTKLTGAIVHGLQSYNGITDWKHYDEQMTKMGV